MRERGLHVVRVVCRNERGRWREKGEGEGGREEGEKERKREREAGSCFDTAPASHIY